MTQDPSSEHHATGLNSEKARRRMSVGLFFLVLAGVLILLPGTLLMIFAGLLLAITPRTWGTALAGKLGIAPVWGVAIVLLGGIAVIGLGSAALAPSVSAQIDELWRQIPPAINDLYKRVAHYSWAKTIIDRINDTDIWSLASRGQATSAVTSAFGYFGNAIILVFIGLYGALDPGTYRRGFLKLFAPEIRLQTEYILSRSVSTLQNWLTAKLIAMSVVGVLTFAGLWFADIPLALVLGLLAGLLAFIPNLGPVLAAAPALLLAMPQGLNMVLIVLGIYLAVQTLESYVITPVIQQQKVSLPPLVVICSQLLFGSLFGLIGLALATPLTALAIQLISDLYIDTYLEQSEPE